MNIKQEIKKNENGSYTRKTVKTTTAEDGFVPMSEMYPSDMDHLGEYHKGEMKVTGYETNDPRVTRPFVYGICGLFICIGIGLLFGKGFVMKFLAAMFIGMGTYALLHGKKEIDNVEQQLQNQQSEDTEDGRF